MARGYWPALLSALILWSHSLRRLINQGVICISILIQIVVTHIQHPPPFTILIGPPGSPQKNKYIPCSPLLPGTKSNENESFPPPPAVQLWVRLLPAGIDSSRLYWLIRAWLMTIKDSISFLIRCGYKGRRKKKSSFETGQGLYKFGPMEYKELMVQPRSSSLVVYIESYSQGYSSGQMNDGYSSRVGWRPNLILPVYIDDGLFFLSTFSIAGRKAPFFVSGWTGAWHIYTIYKYTSRGFSFMKWLVCHRN